MLSSPFFPSVSQCLCVSPTYELALQTGKVIEQMGKHYPEVKLVYAIRGNKCKAPLLSTFLHPPHCENRWTWCVGVSVAAVLWRAQFMSTYSQQKHILACFMVGQLFMMSALSTSLYLEPGCAAFKCHWQLQVDHTWMTQPSEKYYWESQDAVAVVKMWHLRGGEHSVSKMEVFYVITYYCLAFKVSYYSYCQVV